MKITTINLSKSDNYDLLVGYEDNYNNDCTIDISLDSYVSPNDERTIFEDIEKLNEIVDVEMIDINTILLEYKDGGQNTYTKKLNLSLLKEHLEYIN